MRAKSARKLSGKRSRGPKPSRAAAASRADRERAELALSPAERLTLALELSDLCAALAAAGRRAMQDEP